MKKQISRVSLVQNGKLIAALYLVASLPLVLILAIIGALGGKAGVPLLALILFPVMYAVFGFLFTVIGAWLYNLVAARVGGFEFTTAEVNPG